MTPEELRQRAQEAAAEDLLSLYPPSPAAWPDAGGKVAYLAYHAEPLPTGRVRYAVSRPTRRIVVSVADGSVEVEHMAGGQGDGEVGELPPTLRQRLDTAEAALIEVVAGARSPEDAREDLGAYVSWLNAYPVFAAQYEAFAREFVAWLRAGS